MNALPFCFGESYQDDKEAEAGDSNVEPPEGALTDMACHRSGNNGSHLSNLVICLLKIGGNKNHVRCEIRGEVGGVVFSAVM